MLQMKGTRSFSCVCSLTAAPVVQRGNESAVCGSFGRMALGALGSEKVLGLSVLFSSCKDEAGEVETPNHLSDCCSVSCVRAGCERDR